MPKPKKRQVGRDAKTGRFLPVLKAQARKATAIVQRIPIGRRGKAK